MTAGKIMIEKTYPLAEKLLEQGAIESNKLTAILNQEKDNLMQRSNPIMINKIAEEKKHKTALIEQFSRQFNQILYTSHLELNSQGVELYFREAESHKIDTTKSRQHWDLIIQQARQCKQLNQENGLRLNILMQHTQRALQILKGKSRQTTTYGPDGNSAKERFSHALVSV